MKLYIVRHGQTGYNIDNKVCGISDVELTSLTIKRYFIRYDFCFTTSKST